MTFSTTEGVEFFVRVIIFTTVFAATVSYLYHLAFSAIVFFKIVFIVLLFLKFFFCLNVHLGNYIF